jgi:hypothetical protein
VAIKRIEQQLRNGAPVAGNIDLTPRIAQRTAKRGGDASPVQAFVVDASKGIRGDLG